MYLNKVQGITAAEINIQSLLQSLGTGPLIPNSLGDKVIVSPLLWHGRVWIRPVCPTGPSVRTIFFQWTPVTFDQNVKNAISAEFEILAASLPN